MESMGPGKCYGKPEEAGNENRLLSKRAAPREEGVGPRRDPRRDLLPQPATPGEQMGESGDDLPSERVMPEMPGEESVPRDFEIARNIPGK